MMILMMMMMMMMTMTMIMIMSLYFSIYTNCLPFPNENTSSYNFIDLLYPTI